MDREKDDTKIIPNRINKKNLRTGSTLVELDNPDDRITKQTGDGDTLVKLDNPDDMKFEGKFE
ncbi:MAG: hypothetical protein ACOY4Q_08625 [Bacillota bacterium]